MYYLFITKESELESYRKELARVSEAINQGKTPVVNEMRWAKTNLFESVPLNLITGIFMIIGTILISKIHMNEMLKLAVVLIINNFFESAASYIFTCIKHILRVRLCNRLGIEASEKNIASMESLEYQSV